MFWRIGCKTRCRLPETAAEVVVKNDELRGAWILRSVWNSRVLEVGEDILNSRTDSAWGCLLRLVS